MDLNDYFEHKGEFYLTKNITIPSDRIAEFHILSCELIQALYDQNYSAEELTKNLDLILMRYYRKHTGAGWLSFTLLLRKAYKVLKETHDRDCFLFFWASQTFQIGRGNFGAKTSADHAILFKTFQLAQTPEERHSVHRELIR